MDDWNSYDPYEVLNAHNEALHEHGRYFDEFKEIINNQGAMLEASLEQIVFLHNVIQTLSDEVATLKQRAGKL